MNDRNPYMEERRRRQIDELLALLSVCAALVFAFATIGLLAMYWITP